MLKYWVWLSELKGLRNQTKLALLRRFGDPESIFYADPDELMLTEGADPGQLSAVDMMTDRIPASARPVRPTGRISMARAGTTASVEPYWASFSADTS